MKIKQIEKSYLEVQEISTEKRYVPLRPSFLFRTLMRITSEKELKQVHFTYKTYGMKQLSFTKPCLILMNHSSFLDLKIAAKIFYHRPMNIVITSDGIVGKKFLMRHAGCIPTNKFVTDYQLVKDMMYAILKLKTSILLFPEASYSFDGRTTILPSSLPKIIKTLGVPVIMVTTHGSFLHDPLYNCLQTRKVNVSSEVKYLLHPKEIKKKSENEIDEIVHHEFDLDYFKEQQEKGIIINEPFRADGLQRVLYKCPHCGSESDMEGKGTAITCHKCGISYELTETGFLKCLNGEEKFNTISSWYDFQKESVKKEIAEGTYLLDIPVDIGVIKDTNALYNVGHGRLIHNQEGFLLTGCRDTLRYHQTPLASYSLYADYYWYEIGDMISIGNENEMYYCFPRGNGVNVAKARIATEELYKLVKEGKLKK